MYGLVGKMIVVSSQRDALLAILFDGVADMPGWRISHRMPINSPPGRDGHPDAALAGSQRSRRVKGANNGKPGRTSGRVVARSPQRLRLP